MKPAYVIFDVQRISSGSGLACVIDDFVRQSDMPLKKVSAMLTTYKRLNGSDEGLKRWIQQVERDSGAESSVVLVTSKERGARLLQSEASDEEVSVVC